jgi:quercetin dioxygenase-like cupin family protein
MRKINADSFVGSNPEGTKGVDFRPVLAENVNPPNFHLRVFDIAPGGHTPKHAHEWEHEVYVVEGEGKLSLKDRDEPLVAGDAVYIEPAELHQFGNDGAATMRMVCVVPKPRKEE